MNDTVLYTVYILGYNLLLTTSSATMQTVQCTTVVRIYYLT